MKRRSFASDNYAGIHPEILAAIAQANEDHAKAYGEDDYTRAAVEKFQEQFGSEIDVFFVLTGTAANALGLKAATHSYHSILCAQTAHIHVDECGAPEYITGCKLISLPTADGKLSVEQIKPYLLSAGNQHHSQPKVISISQCTEFGTVYTPEEIRNLADFAHQHDLLLHMDGARLANAAASLGVSLKELTADAGVDVLSFGGTKNGLMIGEAVVFFRKELSEAFPYIRKQGMQLASKMRFLSVQFERLLTDDLWLNNARHANRMAAMLAEKASRLPRVRITQKVEANAVFATLPRPVIPLLQEQFPFYVWNEETAEVRWMTAFDTTQEEMEAFVAELERVLAQV